MSKKPKSIVNLRKYTREMPDGYDLIQSISDCYQQNDTTFVILCTALLEGTLISLIKSKIKIKEQTIETDLFGSNAPLATFSSQITVGYYIGLFGQKTRADLDCIRDLRNAFAHSRKHLTFEDEPVRAVCDRLSFPDRHFENGIHLGHFTESESKAEEYHSSQKDRFYLSCLLISYAFSAAANRDHSMDEFVAGLPHFRPVLM